MMRDVVFVSWSLLSVVILVACGLAWAWDQTQLNREYALLHHRLAHPAPHSQTLIGAGDIALSPTSGEATARLLDLAVAADHKTTVFTTGDNAYPDGSILDYTTYYHPSWGRHRLRTRPSPGNHEHRTSGASGYRDYFCPANAPCSFPGDTPQLYYSYDLGSWHIISLDSELIDSAQRAQLDWLSEDLASHTGSCILAYWHHPRFSSGKHYGNHLSVQPFWDALQSVGADVVVNGHEHNYERFAKMTAALTVQDGFIEPWGIRQFVVGTGGAKTYPFGKPQPGSEVRLADTTGVIKFDLYDGGYDWTFVPSSRSRGDYGSETCNKKQDGWTIFRSTSW